MNKRNAICAGCYIGYRVLIILNDIYYSGKVSQSEITGVMGLLFMVVILTWPALILGLALKQKQSWIIYPIFFNALLLVGAIIDTTAQESHNQTDPESGGWIAVFNVFCLGLEILMFNGAYLIKKLVLARYTSNLGAANTKDREK